MLRFLLSIWIFLWYTGAICQEKAIIKSNYIQRILKQKGAIKYVNYSSNHFFLDSLPLKKDQTQQIIKTDKTSIITSSGTGLVYKQVASEDTIIHFTKLDATLYDGYNFDDIKFSYHDTLFSIGGFGFWRNNGQVRYFAENNEWELLFPEIPMGISNRHIWNLDSKKGLLYVITEDGSGKTIGLTINLSSHIWNTNIDITDIFKTNIIDSKEKPIQIQLNDESGSLLFYSDKVYYLNIAKNELRLESNKLLSNFFNKTSLRYNSSFSISDKIYVSNLTNNQIDSISFQKNNFSNEALPVFEIKKTISTFNIILFAIIIISILGLIYYKLASKKIILFTGFEKEFLKILLGKKGKRVDIESLNYLLGLSKKSIEIQKKNRSEFLNKLDHKLKELLNSEEMIIIRVKDDSDKRIFLYQLHEGYFDQINKLI